MSTKSRRAAILIVFVTAACAMAQPGRAVDPADAAERQVVAYVAKLADLHCSESVTQEKLAPNGRVETTQRTSYDYLIMMNGDNDEFQLNESRVATSTAHPKSLPMLTTAGFSTLLLIFHPYYRSSFDFTPGDAQLIDGREEISIRFSQISGRRALAALALRGREYPLELSGTAWLDAHTLEVIRIEANLQRDMSDVGLRSLAVRADYQLTRLGNAGQELVLPTMAVVDVQTPRQHWRNTHVFAGYRAFSAEAEQDPNVKIHASKPDAADKNEDGSPRTNDKEKP